MPSNTTIMGSVTSGDISRGENIGAPELGLVADERSDDRASTIEWVL
jgi:hypothetical protein